VKAVADRVERRGVGRLGDVGDREEQVAHVGLLPDRRRTTNPASAPARPVTTSTAPPDEGERGVPRARGVPERDVGEGARSGAHERPEPDLPRPHARQAEGVGQRRVGDPGQQALEDDARVPWRAARSASACSRGASSSCIPGRPACRAKVSASMAEIVAAQIETAKPAAVPKSRPAAPRAPARARRRGRAGPTAARTRSARPPRAARSRRAAPTRTRAPTSRRGFRAPRAPRRTARVAPAAPARGSP
jgi:hypothetical protein